MEAAQKLDRRIIRVGFEIRGQLKIYDGMAITASGTKFANANQNSCEIAIANMDATTRDYLLTECSPFNKNATPKRMRLDVGRESYGTFTLFEGDFTYATLGQKSTVKEGGEKGKGDQDKGSDGGAVTMSGGGAEMDIWVNLKALTLDAKKGQVIARSGMPQQKLSELAAGVARDLGVPLDFSATDKDISNYAFTGGNLKQVDKLGDAGAVSAYIDDGRLVIKDIHLPLPGFLRVLDIDSGMIGKPEFTEQGIKVKFLIDPKTKLGGALEIRSKTIPAANGVYIIYKLSFEVASRDTPFYYLAECIRYDR
jgi:hypothetical protein